MKPRLLNCLILMLGLFAGHVWADVVVVVSARSAVTQLNADQTARIFLGKVKTFPDGSSAQPLDQPEGSAVRDEFYTQVANKNGAQLTAYWAKVIFTGGDSCPPQLLDGNATVKRAVAANPNAIGYIDKRTVDNSVRVVLEP